MASKSPERTIPEILADEGFPGGAGYRELFQRMYAHGDAEALSFEGTSISYRDLLSMVAGVTEYLEAHGIGRGDHIAFMFRAHPIAVATYLGVIAAGGVLVPLYADLAGEPLLGTLRRLNVKAVVLERDYMDRVEPHRDELPSLDLLVEGLESEYAQAVRQGGDIDRILARSYPALTDPVMILSTSGTTGTPKGVVQFGSFGGGPLIALGKWNIDFPLRGYFCTSFGHGAMAFSSGLVFWQGGSLVIARRFSASRFWEDVAASGANYVHLLGTMQRMIYNQPQRATDRSHGVRLAVSAGMPQEIWADFVDRFGVRVVEMFAATDSGGLSLANDGSFPPGSAGRPWIDFEARLVDDAGAPAAVGELGELYMRPRGREAVIAYYNDEKERAEKIEDGWVKFGDYFRQDQEGNYWFVGRKREIIRRRGINLAPLSIEEPFSLDPRVDVACAFGVPSELGEDEIKLAIVAKDAASISIADLETLAALRLPAYMRPRYIEIVDELPLTTGTQRLVRSRLREGWATSGTWDATAGHFVSDEGAASHP